MRATPRIVVVTTADATSGTLRDRCTSRWAPQAPPRRESLRVDRAKRVPRRYPPPSLSRKARLSKLPISVSHIEGLQCFARPWVGLQREKKVYSGSATACFSICFAAGRPTCVHMCRCTRTVFNEMCKAKNQTMKVYFIRKERVSFLSRRASHCSSKHDKQYRSRIGAGSGWRGLERSAVLFKEKGVRGLDDS